MQPWSNCRPRRRAVLVLAFFAFAAFSCPQDTRAWGRNGHKLVVNKAIDTLPQNVREFFETNRGFLLLHVTDPLDQ